MSASDGTIKITLDGKPVEVPEGANLIEAAKLHGVHIPFFCYHSRLSIAGQCRMCLVDASGVGPPGKLSPGCQVKVAEGMVVNTATPAVAEARRACMEFHLVNHPVDCSICDQSGECKLQDYYMSYDWKPSRLNAYKVVKAKRVVLGPQVVLDQERCILCTRCVRFMTEIAREPQLGVVDRGDHSMIDVFPGQPLDSNYSLNTVDICPVGALLSRDFRFKSRVWFLKMQPSVCAGCSKGCNIRMESKGETIYRYTPRENRAVNDVWLCDIGRLTYHDINEGRVLVARVGRVTDISPDSSEWSPMPETAQGERKAAQDATLRAAAAAAEKIKPLIGQPGLAVALSATASLEDQLAWAWFAREQLKLDKVYLTGNAPGTPDQLLLQADRNPNTAGAQLAAAALGLLVAPFEELLRDVDAHTVKALWMVGERVPADEREVALKLSRLELLVVQAQNEGAIARAADVLLPASSHAESAGTFVNGAGRLQRFAPAFGPRGASRPHWAWMVEVGRALGLTVSYAKAGEVFDALGARSEKLSGLRFEGIPADGVQLQGMSDAGGTIVSGQGAPTQSIGEAKTKEPKASKPKPAKSPKPPKSGAAH